MHKDSCLRPDRLSLTTNTTDNNVTLSIQDNTVVKLNSVARSEACRRIRMKEKVATESVIILGTYFIVSYGSFLVLQYFMPTQFYKVFSLHKYNTLLLVHLLLIVNSALNPLVHYWRNLHVRHRINTIVLTAASRSCSWNSTTYRNTSR